MLAEMRLEISHPNLMMTLHDHRIVISGHAIKSRQAYGIQPLGT
jgi:hypothetical protein